MTRRQHRLPLSEPGATHSSVAAELRHTKQLKTWRLELEAAGSAAATAAQKAEAAELVQLRRDNKRLTEEVEVLRKASAFFAQWAAKGAVTVTGWCQLRVASSFLL